MTGVVLDSSALLAVLKTEAGADQVCRRLSGAVISAVNYAEVISKLIDHGMPLGIAAETVAATRVEVADVDSALALAVGALRARTRSAGLSLGDRACLLGRPP